MSEKRGVLTFSFAVVGVVVFMIVVSGFEFGTVEHHAEYFVRIECAELPFDHVSSRLISKDHKNDAVSHPARGVRSRVKRSKTIVQGTENKGHLSSINLFMGAYFY